MGDENLVVRCFVLPRDGDHNRLKERLAAKYEGLIIQVVSRDTVESEEMVEMMVSQTEKALSRKGALARSAEMDLLLRLAGTTQISEALERVGARNGESAVLVASGPLELISRLERDLPRGFTSVKRREMTREDMMRVERAAVLDALRA